MGYTTWFNGEFNLDKPLTVEHKEVLDNLQKDRHDPEELPGYWCQWVPTNDGTAIVWDDGEKFYNYVEWLEHIIENHLKPWGYVLNGAVSWSGEDDDDSGTIYVKDNAIRVVRDVIVPETDVAIEGAKAVLAEIGGDLMEVIYFNLGNECEHFLDNINDFHFLSEDQEEIDRGIEEISDTIMKNCESSAKILEVIERHMGDCGHVYVKLQRLKAWVDKVSTECEA